MKQENYLCEAERANQPTRRISVKKNVLIVDDEPTLRMVFSMAIKTAGYTAESIGDPTTVIEHLTENDYDMICLDLRMPGMSGAQLAQAIRDEGIDTPIIMCSAHIDNDIVIAGVRLGVVDFLRKPLSMETLRDKVEQVLAGDSRRGAFDLMLHHARHREFELALREVKRIHVDLRSAELSELWQSLLSGDEALATYAQSKHGELQELIN